MSPEPDPRRPQDPIDPLPYRLEEVLLESDGGQVLTGTFTCPPSAKRHAAAVLIPGSGPQDRDETVCGHKPFRVLADHLTRAGIAVLRLDDRGVGGSGGDKNQCTHDDLLRDIDVAVAHLTGHERVDADAIGLIGHSEGAVLAAAAAARDRSIAWLVLMAGPAVPGDQTIHDQTERISRQSGASEQQIAHERRMNEAVFELLKGPVEADAVRGEVGAVLTRFLASWPDAMLREDEIRSAVEAMADIVATPAFRSLLACHPGDDLARLPVRCWRCSANAICNARRQRT